MLTGFLLWGWEKGVVIQAFEKEKAKHVFSIIEQKYSCLFPARTV